MYMSYVQSTLNRLVVRVYGTFTLPSAQRKIGRTQAPAARGCANAATAAMPLPTEAREGCSGLVGEACARRSSMVGLQEAHSDGTTTHTDRIRTVLIIIIKVDSKLRLP